MKRRASSSSSDADSVNQRASPSAGAVPAGSDVGSKAELSIRPSRPVKRRRSGNAIPIQSGQYDGLKIIVESITESFENLLHFLAEIQKENRAERERDREERQRAHELQMKILEQQAEDRRRDADERHRVSQFHQAQFMAILQMMAQNMKKND